jgi:hypothetical protein
VNRKTILELCPGMPCRPPAPVGRNPTPVSAADRGLSQANGAEARISEAIVTKIAFSRLPSRSQTADEEYG